MANREIDPPFRPRVKEEGDIANFDKLYTEEKIQESPNSGNNSHQFPIFDGFTYDQSPQFEIATSEDKKF